MKTITIEDIARTCHNANKNLCHSVGDDSQKYWLEAEQWQRDSAIKGVEFRLSNPDAAASAQHDAWSKDKIDAGWCYGPIKDAKLKQHPCIIPYADLPPEQKAKDSLFIGIVDALKPLLA